MNERFLKCTGSVFKILTGEDMPEELDRLVVIEDGVAKRITLSDDDASELKENIEALDRLGVIGFNQTSVIMIIEAIGALLSSLLDKCAELDFPFRQGTISDAAASKAEVDADKIIHTADLARKPIRGLRVRIGLRARADEELQAQGYAQDDKVNRRTLAESTLEYAQAKNRAEIAAGLEEEYQPENAWW